VLRRALEIAGDADLMIQASKNFLREFLAETSMTETRVAPAKDNCGRHRDPRQKIPATTSLAERGIGACFSNLWRRNELTSRSGMASARDEASTPALR
jgi:hypothetical protein